MEITYDLIIKFLSDNIENNIISNIENNIISNIENNIISNIENNIISNIYISTQHNTLCNNFTLKFNKLLNNFSRYGIINYDCNKNNISFWSSILTLLDDKFNMSIDNDENTKISIFKNNLIDKYNKSKLFFKNNNKNDIRELFKINPDIYVLQYISDILNYTFIVFDIKDDNLYIIYKSLILDHNDPILLFTKYDNLWEPIICNQNSQRIFTYSDDIITKILFDSNIEYFSNDICNKLLELNYNNDIKLDIKNKSDIKINKTKLIKMKINEIIELCKENNFIIPEKYNKNILINIVLENI